jgi:hypothetical protein
MSINFNTVGTVVPTQMGETANIKIVGTPAVKATGKKGSDGSPELEVTLTFSNPIPAGSKGKMEVCTDRCYAGAPAKDVSGKTASFKAFFHHSVDGESEYAKVKIQLPGGKVLEFKFAVKVPGDF